MKEKFTIVNGHKIRYLEDGTSKDTLVLVHGLGASGDRWTHVIPLFAKKFRVIALDLIGFGRSDKPSLDYTLEFFANFLDDFLNRIHISDIYLMGSSMGGQISALYAIANPQRIKKLALVSPSGFMTKSTAALDAYVMAALYPNKVMTKNAFAMMENSNSEVDRAIIDDFILRMKERNAKFCFLSSLLGLQNSKLHQSDLEKITSPTMLLWGTRDPLISIKFAKIFRESIPNCHFFPIEGSGHTPYVQNPIFFANSALEFFHDSN